MNITPENLLQAFIDSGGSDLYVTTGSPPAARVEGHLRPLHDETLDEPGVRAFMETIVGKQAMAHFEETMEYNTAIDWQGKARFRVNFYRQRQKPAAVLRRVVSQVPTLAELGLPSAYAELILEKRGLVLVVGPTGSGKSTSLAAMIDHRNANTSGHIVTIEDPVEFLHDPKQCIVSQRDVGIDTNSFTIALKNVLRQSPDVIMIGEIRDREAMELALAYAETGHLVLATLHANNTNQTIERILHFFSEEHRSQILLQLSLNLRGVLSQRLVHGEHGRRELACEVLLSAGLVRELIKEGKIPEIREQIEKSGDLGMQTFEQHLMQLWQEKKISEDVAIAEADMPANMRFLMKQHSLRNRVETMLEDDTNAMLRPLPEPQSMKEKPAPAKSRPAAF